ncbi:MAG: hypothetical protein N2C14_25975, partial [Planctomycetales bacterium]
WDLGGDDFSSFNTDVAIWNVASPGAPIASASLASPGSSTVASASASGTWRSAPITPVVLPAGNTYRIAGDGFESGGDLWMNDLDSHGLSVSPLISLTDASQFFRASTSLSGVDFPDELFISPSDALIGNVSFEATPVPEPASFALALLAAGLGIGLRQTTARILVTLENGQVVCLTFDK